MRVVEMVCLMNAQCLAGLKTRTNSAGARARFRPFGTEIEPRLAQVVVKEGITEELDCYTLAVRE